MSERVANILNNRGVSQQIDMSEAGMRKMFLASRQLAAAFTVFEPGELPGAPKEVCHNGQVVVHNNEMIYYKPNKTTLYLNLFLG